MRIQVLSDLHLEAQPEFTAEPDPEADVLVLAGDIGSYQRNSKLPNKPQRDFGLGQFAAASHGGRWPKVLYVPGNHEYDANDFDEVHRELQSVVKSLGITWLEREVHVHAGVRFVGTTLWTDFDALSADADPMQAQELRRKAHRAADFYLGKAAATRRGRPLMSEAWRELGLECQMWLKSALSTAFHGPTVVVTHFAPSLLSADPRYGITPSTAGFCNSIDELVAVADLWIHGHLHCPNDYRITSNQGECRVVSNPLGYARKGEQHGFAKYFVVQVG